MAKKANPPLSRRAWITTTSGVIAAGLIKTQADAVKIVAQEVPTPAQDPTKVPGRLTSELGQRAPAEQPRRLVRSPNLSSSSRTPLQDLYGIITLLTCTLNDIMRGSQTLFRKSMNYWSTVW